MKRNRRVILTWFTLTFYVLVGVQWAQCSISSSSVGSPSVVASSSLAGSSLSSAAVSLSLAIDQSTPPLTSVSSVKSVLVSPSASVSLSFDISSSLARSSLSAVAVGTTVAIDQSTSVLPLVSSTLVSSTLSGIGATTVSLAPTQTASSPVSSACTSQEFLKGSSGFFSSPNFPNSFPRYSNCTWNITVPTGYIIKISFLYFQLGRQQDGAQLTINNVASSGGRLYGWSLPYPVYSVGNSIQAIFHSYINQFSGFSSVYRAITYESVCPNFMTLKDTSGAITSPYYPRNYPVNQTCSWQITASKGKRVTLVIEDMDIQTCDIMSCRCDYLEIQNGFFSGDGFTAGRLCGQLRNPVTFYSFHETLKVLFVGRLSGYRGFKATYTQMNYTASTECFNYTFLNESSRARAYSGMTYLCDTALSGWYRFSGAAGSQMAESCVDRKHCGTDAPGWLDGSHPGVVDGVVQRSVCFNHFNNCCHYSTYISVRNCGGYYVYKLKRPPHCNLRYCGNGLSMAPECYNYRFLNESNRARTYHNRAGIMLCDRTLSASWYRFSGEAGSQMADSCVDEFHCGTDVPGWLDGPHPGVADGRVQRRVCFTYLGICCSDSTYISVRNCGGFYVYKLNDVSLIACSSRYCGNGFVPTPPAETSPPTTEITKPTTQLTFKLHRLEHQC